MEGSICCSKKRKGAERKLGNAQVARAAFASAIEARWRRVAQVKPVQAEDGSDWNHLENYQHPLGQVVLKRLGDMPRLPWDVARYCGDTGGYGMPVPTKMFMVVASI
eukprot:CAMPEP_0171075576 /NCGR_PEP_ID=MMETSP0766_2-20121228/12859_1 /TAXON_ID=439317 /ORGANISM="Gambierdiscus australes, Strain CAWD 149" /LENGTH=106 /DNA_ID=CAMNT_0011532457 /DNA_START=694 /DNA_END=1015 /DNA_ORIENTATION=-